MGEINPGLLEARSRVGLVLTLLEELRESTEVEGEEEQLHPGGTRRIAEELARLGDEVSSLARALLAAPAPTRTVAPGLASGVHRMSNMARPLVLLVGPEGTVLAGNDRSSDAPPCTRADLGEAEVRRVVAEALAPGAPATRQVRLTGSRGARLRASSLVVKTSRGETDSVLLTVTPDALSVPPTNKHERLVVDGPLPMWAIDRRTLAFVNVNRAMVREYGYSRDDLLEMRLLDLSPAAEKRDLLDALATWSGASEMRFQGHHRIRDGSMVDVEITLIAAELGGAPVATGVSWTATKISGRWAAAR